MSTAPHSKGGPFEKINSALIAGLTYSALGKAYSYIDSSVTPGTLYYYKLEDIDAYGKTHLPRAGVRGLGR